VRCARCQQGNSTGAKFCNACGAPLEAVCAVCRNANVPGSRFCNECGRSLAEPPPGFTVSQDSTPRHLADKIMRSRHALEGERKQVTVLFADMKGSMELLADRDPEDARRLIDPVLSLMMEAVHRYEGTVNQVMGDGIMALFGAPLAHEDHAARACYAALAMQRAAHRYTEEVRRDHGIEVQIRVGLNSGEVVVRAIGSDLRMDYSAVGQTTHLAARMEQLASPGTIRLTSETLRLADGFIEVTPLGPVPVKGLLEPVQIFELTGGNPTRTRLQTAAARGLTRFVGRVSELEQLGHALEHARAGHGQVLAAVGEPGVGKSRLFFEFVRSHRTHGWRVLESSSVAYGKAAAYLPAVELLKAYFQIEGSDDARKIREKVTGKLLTLDEALRSSLSPFLALLDVAVDDPAWLVLDSVQRRRQTLDGFRRLLLRESQVQPVCVVCEDLHWIDPDTQGLLDGLVDALPMARLLLLVNYRPEYQHGWGSKTYYNQLRLDSLPADGAGELLDALLGDDPELEPLKRRLIEATEGNPFFLEESVRTLVEEGALTGERGGHRLAGSLDTIHVPDTVRAVLAARIDRLPPEEKDLLQAAAVIGKDVPLALLQAITEPAGEFLWPTLDRLQGAEFLYQTALFPELELTFKHTLTQEVAYSSLLQDRRRTLHARIVQAFESLYPERVTERVGWLTHHAFRGEVWAKAVAYLQGVQEERPTLDGYPGFWGSENPGHLWWRGDHRHAVRTAQQQHGLGAALPPGIPRFALEIVTNLRLGQAYHSLGEYLPAMGFLRRNLALFTGEVLHDFFYLAGLPSVFSRTWLALCLGERGELTEGLACGEEAVRIAEAAGHSCSIVVGCFGLGSVHLLRGDLLEANALLERGVALARDENFPQFLPFIAPALASCYALSGRVRDAIPLLHQAVEQAVSLKLMANHPYRLCELGAAHILAGEREHALHVAEQAIDLAREQEERGHEAYAFRLLGEIASHADHFDLERAESYYRNALALADQLVMRPLQARCLLGLGALYRRAGHDGRARDEVSAAIDLFRELGMTFWLRRAESMVRAR
jgi:class 3 adenylate cyclase/tetratricopeptide (TPR) repeat protein